ncbi:MAG: site-2 protease family protein [Bryobacteraceae bacterium]
MDADTLALGPIWYVIFLLSITCHEAAHALAAKLGGDMTAFHSGQVSLNPFPHIRREPFGTVLVPLISYVASGFMIGWASAPYDPLWQRRHPKRAALMSLAGPAANFILVLIAAVIMYAGISAGAFQLPRSITFTSLIDASSPGAAEGVAQLVSVLFSLNLLLGTFNLLPVPPLDGFGALTLFASPGIAAKLDEWSQMRAFALLGLVIAWRLFDYIYPPIFMTALQLLYAGMG